MNRRLPFGEIVSSFPFGEVDALQSLIDKPKIMIDVNGLIEPFRKQHQLVPSQLHLRKSHHPLLAPPILPKNQNQNRARQSINRQAVTRRVTITHLGRPMCDQAARTPSISRSNQRQPAPLDAFLGGP
jgi:hypothetical protein